MVGSWRLILLEKNSFSLPFSVSIYDVSKLFFSFFASFDLEKTKVSIPGIKLFIREMLYPTELSWGDTLLLPVCAVCCCLSCASCAAAHVLFWLTVKSRHVALFLPLSWVPWLQEEQLAKRSSFFVSWELVGPSFLPPPPPKKVT